MPELGVIIQARMGSRRLPGKVLMPFGHSTVLGFQVELLRQLCERLQCVVATTVERSDDVLVRYCIENGICVFQGSSQNVFQRLLDCADHYKFNNFVRLTGDNPCVDFGVLKECITSFRQYDADLTTTRKIHGDGKIERYVTKGQSVDIVKVSTMRKLGDGSLTGYQEEHVIPAFFSKNCDISYVRRGISSGESLSIDTRSDYERVKQLIDSLMADGHLDKFLDFRSCDHD